MVIYNIELCYNHNHDLLLIIHKIFKKLIFITVMTTILHKYKI